MHTTGLCPSGDVVLHYRHFGAGGELPLVIVHGLSFFSSDWIVVAEALAELETLFSDPGEVDTWLRQMPLRR